MGLQRQLIHRGDAEHARQEFLVEEDSELCELRASAVNQLLEPRLWRAATIDSTLTTPWFSNKKFAKFNDVKVI
jgi:hypothetical protein